MDIQRDIETCLISCIASRKGGVPVHEINDDFKSLTGYSIPFLSLGYPNLLAFIASVKEIYFEKDEDNNEVLIVDSRKSRYLKKLIEKQKPVKRKLNRYHDYDLNSTVSSIQSSIHSSQFGYFYKTKRRRATLIQKEVLDTLTPIMYGYQLLGDEIFLEIAENSLLVHVNKTAPRRCGLCITGQTIKDLIDNLDLHHAIPSRVAILIGLSDLLNNKTSKEMISDMELLINELKTKKINATIFTLPQLNCVPNNRYFALRKFNDYILSQADEKQGISVMNLEEMYHWYNNKDQRPSKWSYKKDLLNETERNIILEGIKDYFRLNYEYEV